MSTRNSSPLPQYVTDLIKATATRLARSRRFCKSDKEDIEQAIALEVVRRRRKFDPVRAVEEAFYTCLIGHAVADILARRIASCRNAGKEGQSLDMWVQNDMGEMVRRVETLTRESARRHLAAGSVSDEETLELAVDLQAIVAALPTPLQRICKLLMCCATVQEVAREAGVHRCTVYESMHKIREAFLRAGLEQYLPSEKNDPTLRSRRG